MNPGTGPLSSQAQPDELFDFTNGIVVDRRLAPDEIRVQVAWANALAKAQFISSTDRDDAIAALKEAGDDIAAGRFEWRVRDEDIHMHLESYVTAKAGDIGKRMHVGRSRNDLIATTLRLYAQRRLIAAAAETKVLARALLGKAQETRALIVPGMTHLQHGQPVRMAHILLSYAGEFADDGDRLARAAAYALETMPLGAAALAGSPLPLDYKAMAAEMGFAAPCRNSYSAVGNRDFMLHGLNALSLLAVHLGRLAEDCIYWSSTAIGLLKLSPAWSTGSSIMPNKRNPDIPELTRGKVAHIIAAAANGAILMRTVPTSYGSDLHELKGVFMRAADQAEACLKIWPPFIEHGSFDKAAAARLLEQGHILGTEIADAMVENGTPFRDAYHAVKVLIAAADREGVQVHELTPGGVNMLLTEEGLERLDYFAFGFEDAVERRNQPGGTALARVDEAIAEMKKRVG